MSVPVLRSTTTGRTMLDDGDEEYVDNDGYDDYADLMTMTRRMRIMMVMLMIIITSRLPSSSPFHDPIVVFCVVFLMVEGYVTQVANYRPNSIAVDTIP